MNHPLACHGPNRQAQHGAVTLLVVMGLVMLASLASLYSTRSVFIDRLAHNNQSHATQSRLAAESALAWARAELARQYSGSPSASDIWQTATPAPCPAGHLGPRWQCIALTPPAHPDIPEGKLQVLAVRDLLASPHVTELHAFAQLDTRNSQSRVQASVFVPTVARAPHEASTAALVLNGCASAATGAAVSLCPTNANDTTCSGTPTGPAVHSFWLDDSNRDGVISAAEHLRCLAFPPANLPAGGDLTGPASAMPRAPCSTAAWNHVLGDITPTQLQAWSDAQQRNGLHAQSQPPRSIYWIDSAASWTQSLGQPNAPVLLVFSAAACAVRCPSIASGVRILGTVVLQTQCQDEKVRGWQAGVVEGQVVVESGLPDLQSGSLLQARAYAPAAYQLAWPAGMDASQVQRVAGSWREGVR